MRSISPGISAQGAFVNPEKLAAHLQVDRYGDFWLTEAVRPSLDLQVVPREGFRVGVYRDAQAKLEVPVLVAAVSRERRLMSSSTCLIRSARSWTSSSKPAITARAALTRICTAN